MRVLYSLLIINTWWIFFIILYLVNIFYNIILDTKAAGIFIIKEP
jgi:hypothetical protein